MALTDYEIVVEFDLVEDALREVIGILDRVRFRHGGRFRRLERLIEEATGDHCADGPSWQLGPGRFVVGVPFRIAAVIAEAKRLQV